MNNYKTLYDYIKAYQSGENILHELITHHTVAELNEKRILDNVTRLKFTDIKLEQFKQSFKGKYYWVDELDIHSWMLSGLFGDDGKSGILHKANLSYSPQQLINWVYKRLSGHISNMIEKENADDRLTIREWKDDLDTDDMTRSYYDDYQFSKWSTYDTDNKYIKFLKAIGGIKSILTSRQYQIYLMLHEQNATQEAVAKELNISQQMVSKTMQTGLNKIRKEYLSFKTLEALATDKISNYQRINKFLEDYNTIIKFDVGSTYDYFGYVVHFVRSHQPAQVSFKDLHSNKNQYDETITDILTYRLKQNQITLYDAAMDDLEMSDRDKDKFVLMVLKIFNNYIEEIHNHVDRASDTIINKLKLSDDNALDVAKLYVS